MVIPIGKLAVDRNVGLLHLTVLIWGFTGVLGELISVSALYLVWYRVLIAAVSLWLYFILTKTAYVVPIRLLIYYMGVGLIVGMHWVLFFHSIKIATVSVTLVTISSVTLFTAVLEPLMNRSRISRSDVVIGLLMILGIYLIFTFEFQYFWGILYGLVCALCASIFSICNAKLVKTGDPKVITFYEMVGAFLGVTVVLWTRDAAFGTKLLVLSTPDLLYLLLLGVVCTAIAYVLGVAVMRQLSAFTVALTTNLEPVYGILLALLIFGEKEAMSTGFYAGAVLIMIAVFAYPYVKTRWINQRATPR